MKFVKKYEIKKIDDIFGNIFLSSLKNSVLNNKIPNCLLINGRSGTGKTGLAKSIVLLDRCQNKILNEPCMECSNCKKVINSLYESEEIMIDNDDIFYCNMASVSKKENLSTIINQLSYIIDNKNRFIIIDECQEMSNSDIEILISELEEIKDNIKVIFITNNLDKVSDRLRTNSVIINLENPSLSEMSTMLGEICKSEEVQTYRKNNLLRLIAKSCNNNPKQCINMLEYILSSGELNSVHVYDCINWIDVDLYIDYMSAIFEGIESIMNFIFEKMQKKNVNYNNFLRNMNKFLCEVFETVYGGGIDWYSETQTTKIKDLFKNVKLKTFILMQDYVCNFRISMDLNMCKSQLIILGVSLNERLNKIYSFNSPIGQNIESVVEEKYNESSRIGKIYQEQVLKKDLNSNQENNKIQEQNLINEKVEIVENSEVNSLFKFD